MRPSAECDVIIAGAGPAGSYLAYLLATSGLRVVLLEKKQIPRYKACGGGLTTRARKHLPFDLGEIVDDAATTARLYVNGRRAFERTYPQAVVSMVMRDKLDAFLADQAAAAGAQVEAGVRFRSGVFTDDGVIIDTSAGQQEARCLVGADGAHSRVARHLGLTLRYRVMTAIEAELEVDAPAHARFRHAFDFDFGVIAQGYGWVFPKKDHLSAGILTRRSKAPMLERDFRRYLDSKGLGTARARSLRLHPIPYAPHAGNRYANRAGLVVGDASGMVDPITGEGIYYALRTARLAAAAIGDYFKRGIPLATYDDTLRATVGRELRYAGWLAAILYRLPWLSHPLLSRCGDRIAPRLLDVFQGQVGYPELFRYVVGWRGLKQLLAAPAKSV